MTEDVETPSERSQLLSKTQGTRAVVNAHDSDASSDAQPSTSVDALRGVAICLCIFILLFILTCNVSSITTIQSSIVADLKSYSSTSWFSSVYLMAITSVTPLVGRMCKIFSPRNFLLVSIALEACGILLTSQARSLPVFLAGRAIIGAGGATVTPVAYILINDLASVKRRSIFFGLMNVGFTTGVAVGGIVAGALEPVVGWRAVFWLQIPVLAVAALLAFVAIPLPARDLGSSFHASTTQQKLLRIDYLGLITLVVSVVLIIFGLSSSSNQIWPILLGFVVLALFILIEFRWAGEPIIPPAVLKSKGNILTGFAVMGVMMSRWSVILYTPVFGIAVRNWSQATAGLTIIPANIGFGLGGVLVGALHIRRSGSFYVPTLLMILLFAAVQFVSSRFITTTSNIHGYLLCLLANGLLTGAMLNYSLAHILHLSLAEMHMIVLPINAMFRSLSGSLGSAFCGGVFLRSLEKSIRAGFEQRGLLDRAEMIHKLLGSPALVHQLTGVDEEVAVQGYQTALQQIFLVTTVLSLCMVPVMAGAGWTAPRADEKTDDVFDPVAEVPPTERESVTN